MNKKLKRILSELENFYIGWIYNPLIDLRNGFVDFHNARTEQRHATPLETSEDDQGLFATVNGVEQRIRKHWFETDMLRVLSKATGTPVSQLKKRLKSDLGQKRPSKR